MKIKYDKCIIGGHRYLFNSKRIVGKGRYSSVYAGIIENTNDMVAIKMICLKKLSNTNKIVIEREINAINKLMSIDNHNNVLKYYDIIRTETYVYIVMEYCENNTLSSLLLKPLKEKYIKYYFKQIVNGLYWLHKNNITHNDIKPNNILITNDYKTLKICDFGFAKTDNSRNDIICGTSVYMAPELLKNKNSGMCADIWSLGIILYEFIYGERPYNKNIKIKKSNNICNDICNDGLKLLKLLLEYNTRDRIKIIDIVGSKWLNSINKVSEINLSDVYYRLNPNI